MDATIFDRAAEEYDAWYESARGSAIFRAEIKCVEYLLPSDRSGWVDVGTGTGRFAAALEIPSGIDPSANMRRIATERNVDVQPGTAENLPCGDGSMNGILMVATLCFIENVHRALNEAARVLIPGGALLVGMIPADSPWGRYYQRRAKSGHPFYSAATFHTCDELRRAAADCGFEFESAASTLQSPPEQEMIDQAVCGGINPDCGFVALLFRRA